MPSVPSTGRTAKGFESHNDKYHTEGVTEILKACDQLEWIRQINSCRARAEEQVIREKVLA
ncbi:MAG: TnpV protein [Clostridia bacterium]|nr:TnpV protein [Clostridia bacterium]